MTERSSSGLSLVDRPAVGLRVRPDRRHHDERRTHERAAGDRRRFSRRGARLRNVLFSALAIAIPPRANPLLITPRPHVSISVEGFAVVPAREAYDHIIREAALLYALDPALIRSVIEAESDFDTSAVSSAGATGLMQLMPSVAASLGVSNLLDPRENIMAGAELLRELLDRHHGSLPLALASYNAGASAVARFGRVPPFPETQAYVRKVTQLLKKSRETAGA